MRPVDALETVTIALIEAHAPIPAPSPARGRPAVSLPALSAAKVAVGDAA